MKRTIAIIGLVIIIGMFIIIPTVLMYNVGGWEGVFLFWGIMAIVVVFALAFDWCINNFES